MFFKLLVLRFIKVSLFFLAQTPQSLTLTVALDESSCLGFPCLCRYICHFFFSTLYLGYLIHSINADADSDAIMWF